MTRPWADRAALVLAALAAGWMVADGTYALIRDDYVGGEIGPWRHVAGAVGIEPLSTPMKCIFVAYGATWLVVCGAFLRGRPWARRGMLLAAAGSLWYLVLGTASSAVQIALLTLGARWPRPRRA